MSQSPAPIASAAASSEIKASPSSSSPLPAPRLRSCITCRSRKVRCDKQSPCSNCRRAKIPCVLPLTDQSPRWARRLERSTNHVTTQDQRTPQGVGPVIEKVKDRLRTLENLVKELSNQLDEARAVADSAGSGSSGVNSAGSAPQGYDAQQPDPVSINISSAHKQFGRMVLQDGNRTRYVSSGFWSRINDELDELKMDVYDLAGDGFENSESESPGNISSVQGPERTPSERNAFLFRHNPSLSAPNLAEFRPLPSQVPFLLDVFVENVNRVAGLVHMPTVTKIIRDWRASGMTQLTPSNEALMFSMYYAAIVSMDEDDVVANFGARKSDVSLKYRLGLETALARADFLNAPDLVLVQAFALFLSIARRDDTPRSIWMLTGLLIRMAHYLGLQRDGSHFEHLTPFEIEMRRRVWWLVCALDARASEDQGTDLTITYGSFDTKVPLNINHADIDPESKEIPEERSGMTDMTFAHISAGMSIMSRKIVAAGLGHSTTDLKDQTRRLNKIYQEFEQTYLHRSINITDIIYWVAATIARLVMAKLTLIIFLPLLFSSPNEDFSDEIRNTLLSSAIEVAEYNHALNSEQACRQWRWVYQTYTHWYSIVYLMIEISRRPWSPIVERAWVALHSRWLIPAQAQTDQNSRTWFPLRRLMNKGRNHRTAEISRLRADPEAAARLELDDERIPLPSSPGPCPTKPAVDFFRERWRQLLSMSDSGSSFNIGVEETYLDTGNEQSFQGIGSTNAREIGLADIHSTLSVGETAPKAHNTLPTTSTDWFDSDAMGQDFALWPLADAEHPSGLLSNVDNPVDTKMDLDIDSEMTWYNWLNSVNEMEWDARNNGNDTMG
ncbi:hypothetical protein PVAR5_1215 [Paecilomyces variotii No. 5]|uniref:Zn(2)-C6 fungal-type domain-containing protein n=1 Tax=Byssochlamys spectabilis (strain No. 5 / NBRC 109023) TaxID=1356009 RepID=V5FVJ4_BYSSN|nr:hypothetical protein PVAR5_1215 [Paecilomyces variotii No. 5]